jgi:CheY-like chemotaxis protein
MIKALIVDDEYHNRSIVRIMLGELGCDIMEAEDGIEAEQLALDWQPDLIILDIMMPKQDGYQTCRNLKRKGYQGQIVMLTSLLQNAAAVQATNSGADACYTKPISVQELQDCINKCG